MEVETLKIYLLQLFTCFIVSPLWVKLQGVNKAMSAGLPYEISCQVFGANPSPVITWWLGTVKVKIYEKSVSNN